jgi:ADP-ribosylarginine hydrolase
MSNISNEKLEAGFMLASYLDTLGFRNGIWEFNYGYKLNNIDIVNKVWLDMLLDFFSLGGFSSIDISKWNASDDTILLIATAKALVHNTTYKKEYLNVLPALMEKKRSSGFTTIDSLKLLKYNGNIPSNKNMGGNGAAMRTGSIGIKWHNDEEKIIEEAIKASVLTHNYYIGYMGGVITALFSAYALNNIEPKLWIDKLLNLYENKKLHKYFPKDHDIKLLDNYINYWKKYKEFKINKPNNNYIPCNKHLNFLMSFNPSEKIQEYVKNKELLVNKDNIIWNNLGITGIDSCIYAYDCLLNCYINNRYSWENFMINVAIHIGDNDTTGCIGGLWFGLLLGYNDSIDKNKMQQLEFYDELLYISKNIL